MIETIKKIIIFSGNERKNIYKSILFCFLNAIAHMLEIVAIYLVVSTSFKTAGDANTALYALALLITSILAVAVTKYFSQLQQTHAGYFMAADKRIEIARKLKKAPMGYFNENSLGEITGVSTSVIGNVETIVPMVLVMILSGLINALVFTLMILVWDWRIGLLVVLASLIYLLITSKMEQKSRSVAPERQKAESNLVAAVLEYVDGMSVIKSFNLSGRGDKRVQNALEYSRHANLNLEKLYTPYTMAQAFALQLFSVVMIFLAVSLWIAGSMTLLNVVMSVVMSFLVFAQIESTGSGLSLLRIVSSCMDRVHELATMPQMDTCGQEIEARTHEIVFEHVSFSYDQKETLHDISLTIPDRTTAAFIGPSGSGKTTLCNLMARFWDVDAGTVSVAGRNVRDYTLESLMAQISMVFQNVYLFADTIENNIKFGKPDATHEEVVQAAKKACCDTFIEALPDAYDTVIGEGGASLSGGEKQRLSIARAILKDAPIIILDEATANVDPENEDRLQKAIEALTRNKTIIMIAHRLKTVRNADQIFVVDDGKIVQQGKHAELMEEGGLYRRFVEGRKEAANWKL